MPRRCGDRATPPLPLRERVGVRGRAGRYRSPFVRRSHVEAPRDPSSVPAPPCHLLPQGEKGSRRGSRTRLHPPASPRSFVDEGQRSAARRGGFKAASIEPGCGAEGLSHPPHAPWRSACRRFESHGPRLSGWGSLSRAFHGSVRLIASSSVPRRALDIPSLPASSSHRGRSTPRAVPAASRVRGANPAAGRRPPPAMQLASGWPPLGMRWVEDRGGLRGGD
jgi:hypothetical protein